MTIPLFPRIVLKPVAALVIGLCAFAASAQDFPTKPVRIIVPAAAGGSLDLTARLIGQKMSEKLGQQVIVDNRPGAETLLGTHMVKEAPADGYTILAQANGFTMLPQIKLDLDLDVLKDFTGLGNMVSSPFILLVGGDQPDRTVQDFVARAKTSRLTYASGGIGNPPQLSAAIFLRAAGLNNVAHVGYKGNGAALPDVAGGRVNMIFDGYVSSKAYIDGGKLRALAVTSANRITTLPDVPTMAELGFNATYKLWLGLIVRSGTPGNVVQRLSDALKYAQGDKELSARFRAEGSDPTFTSPQEFTEYLKNEYQQNAKLAADLKLEKH